MGPAEWVIIIGISAYAVANLVIWIAERAS